MSRISRLDYYLNILETVTLRATCNRGKSGAVLVKDGRVIATGYVGSPVGARHCDDHGHLLERRQTMRSPGSEAPPVTSEHCIRTVHAEMNAIIQAARFGPSTEGAILYCTMFPCFSCAKVIVNAGIKKVIALHDYQRSDESKSLFDEVRIGWTIEHAGVPPYEE